jgi:hypothetical protein
MHAAHPWGSSTGRHAVVARIWQDWHAWTSHPTSTLAAIPWERDIGMKPDLSGVWGEEQQHTGFQRLLWLC